MKKLSVLLTNYIIEKGITEESERDVYEYGFQTGAETVLSLVICIFIAFLMNMPIEGVFFFLFFIPLRIYAGGLHMEHYWGCLLLSFFTFFGVLLIVSYVEVPILVSLIGSELLLGIIWLLYPIENSHRPVDKDENNCFKRKIKVLLIFDTTIGIIFMFFTKDNYLFLMALTLMLVVFTMILGKIKYKN